MHRALGYDVLVWLLTHGREQRFREMLLGLAQLREGETVLDIGCGTGSLAIAARRLVGQSGDVHGIDASPQMIARAAHKARKARVEVEFHTAAAETLPFPDDRFDAVLSTLMLHHLPKPARQRCVADAWRILKPGGRLLAVDFAQSGGKRGLIGHFHRHGHTKPQDIRALLTASQFSIVDGGAVGWHDLHFFVGRKI